MIKFITTPPSSPFNFILKRKVGGGGSRFELTFKPELKKLTFLGWNFGKTSSSLRELMFLVSETSFYLKPYRNPSKLNKFEFGG